MLTPEFITYLAIILAGFIAGIITFNRQVNLKPIIILLCLTFISECLSRICAYHIKNSSPPYHFLFPLQCLLWGDFFFRDFKSGAKKRFARWSTAILAAVSIANSAFNQGVFVYPGTMLQIQSLLLITLGFQLFIEKLDIPTEQNIFLDQGFVLATAVIWFHLISIIFNSFYSFLLANVMAGETLRLINYVSNYLYYGILAVSVLLLSARRQIN